MTFSSPAGRSARALAVVAGLLLLLTTGCLEQLSTTRLPAGATRNFFYYLMRNEQVDALTYWAPGQTPPDAAAQVAHAAARLALYDTEVTTAAGVAQPDGAMLVTVTGHAHRKGAAADGATSTLLSARLIEIGPGWRVTQFELVCCPAP